MVATVAVITPAYRVERWIVACVRSVLAQTYTAFEHVIIADDGVDYEALLAAAGIRDGRLKFLSSGAIGGGASRARNVALDAIGTDHAAILDADDRFKPDKLERAVAALEHHAIVRAGDFFYIPADMPHLPFNASSSSTAVAVIARTDPNEQESVVLLPELEAIHPA